MKHLSLTISFLITAMKRKHLGLLPIDNKDNF